MEEPSQLPHKRSGMTLANMSCTACENALPPSPDCKPLSASKPESGPEAQPDARLESPNPRFACASAAARELERWHSVLQWWSSSFPT